MIKTKFLTFMSLKTATFPKFVFVCLFVFTHRQICISLGDIILCQCKEAKVYLSYNSLFYFILKKKSMTRKSLAKIMPYK